MVKKAEKELTLISIAQTSNQLKEFNKKLGQQGMTIVEILVSLFLIVLIFTVIPMTMEDSGHEKVRESIEKIDRAIRFSTNESILRNSIVRIRIDLEASPNEYVVEYGEGADFVLPESKDLSRLGIKERELELKKTKKLDSQFKLIDEFSESAEQLPEGIIVYGIGTTYYPKMILEGSANIYFYPTGEKDNAILFFHNDEELATLKVSPFEEKTFDEYFPFSESELANLDYSLENKTKEIFEKWIKE
jgi:hypothetical protein